MPVKPGYVKDMGNLILEQYGHAVSVSFEHNKEVVEEVTNIESKSVRNRVAGYLTRKRRVAHEREAER